MHHQHLKSWVLVPIVAALLGACTFDTAGLKDLSQNNTNNLNNINNINNVTNPVCGDNTAEGAETCDGTDLTGRTCATLGFETGTLACAADCASFVTTGCEGTGPVCGNATIEGTETCDGTNLAGQTCVSLGYLSGNLACAVDCTSFDASDCEGATCGNGVVEGLELCDGDNLAGNTCIGLGYAKGNLACDTDCLGFITTGCTNCGNDAIDGDELCDGANLAGNTCTGLGFADGDLACDPDCAGFDTSGCATQACGNNNAEGTELCDGTDLNGHSCLTQGFYGGTLACNAGCSAFVTTGCSLCGNEIINAPEACDGGNLNGQSCLTQGCRVPGTLLCNANCNAFLLTGCWINHDEDGDGVDDNCDNCPTYANLNQANADGDQVGDVCESPAAPTALGTINAFESMNGGTTTWTTLRGTWMTAADQVAGTAGADTDGNYFHSLTLPANNYSVEVNYYFRAAPVVGANWSGVIFGWQTSNGSLSNAYECVFERDSKELQIWKYAGSWQSRAVLVINTAATDGQSRKIRGTVSGNAIRCDYSDASGATGNVTWTDAGSTAGSFTGRTGYRLYNEAATFTSFVYYLP